MTTAGMRGNAALMDRLSAFTLLLSCPDGIPRSRVHVDFSASYDRIPHPDVKLEDSINVIWTRRTEKNHSLYNGQKFRYGGHTFHHVPDDNNKSSVCLHLGLTDYRTFVGTNLSPLWVKFLVPLEDDAIKCQHTASPLGNGAIVETADKRVLVLHRSHNVGEFPGYCVFPGGHSEPGEIGISTYQTMKNSTDHDALIEKISQEMFNGIMREVVEESGVPAESLPGEIGISAHQTKKNSTDHKALIDKISQEMFNGIFHEVVEEIGVPAKSLPGETGISTHRIKKKLTDHEALMDKVSQEMFNGIIREVVEEVGVPAESLNDPIFIGISRRDLNVRPAAFFFISCNLESQEIQQLYSGAQHAYESIQLSAVSEDELPKMSEKMPGCHRGGYALYELMKKAVADREGEGRPPVRRVYRRRERSKRTEA